MEKKWIYFGVFLDSISKAKNLSALETNGIVIPNDWKRFNHHMTIAFNDGSKEVYDLYKYYQIYLENPSMETDITLTINGIGVSDDAIALRVDWRLPIANKIPHITMATPQTGKPVNSNKITEWVDIEPYTIKGIIRKFENINKKTIGIKNMKVTTKHEKTDFGDVWHMSSVPKDIFRFAIYRYDDDKDTVYLSNVFVDNAHRKQGLGNSILNTADKIAKKLNAKIICLKVKQDSFVHEWYGRHGYSDLSVDEEEPQFIWMTKNIGEIIEVLE